jgi:alkaline phosphatase D
VVLLSGDSHVAELNCIPWSDKGGYDFYDLTSSPLAQRPDTGWPANRPEVRIRQVFGGDCNFGLLRFDTSGDPTLTYNVFDTEGRAAWQPFSLRAGELVNGVVSWRDKMDAQSRENFDRWRAGGDYYKP